MEDVKVVKENFKKFASNVLTERDFCTQSPNGSHAERTEASIRWTRNHADRTKWNFTF